MVTVLSLKEKFGSDEVAVNPLGSVFVKRPNPSILPLFMVIVTVMVVPGCTTSGISEVIVTTFVLYMLNEQIKKISPNPRASRCFICRLVFAFIHVTILVI